MHSFSLPWVVFTLLCFVQSIPTLAADKPTVIELWPGKAPDEVEGIGAEKEVMSPKLDRKQVEVTESTRMITNVTKPTITVYRPEKAKDAGTAVIVCPGGGYWNLYWQLEGEEVAEWLTSLGVTAVVLKYRVPRRPDDSKDAPARRPLQDAQRAVSLMRSKAKEWGVATAGSASSGFRRAGTWRSRPPPRSRNGPTTRPTTWTRSVAARTSPSLSTLGI